MNAIAYRESGQRQRFHHSASSVILRSALMMDTTKAPITTLTDDRHRTDCSHEAVEPDAELVLVELRRVRGDGCEIAGLVSNPQHAHCKRRKKIGLGKGISEAAAIAQLVVKVVDRAD